MIQVYKKIGRRLRRYRRLARHKQITVAKKLKIESSAIISRWERGKTLPSLKHAIRLSKLYKTTVNELFGELDQLFGKELHTDILDDDSKNFDNGP